MGLNQTDAVRINTILLTIALLAGCAAPVTNNTDAAKSSPVVPVKPAELEVLPEIKMHPEVKAETVTENAFDLTKVADDAYKSEEWPVAAKYYRRLTQQVPQDAYGYFRLGNVLMQQGRVDAAIKAFDQALIREPGHMRALKNRSLAYLFSAELHMEETVKIMQSRDDTATENYRTALLKLQRLNSLPLNDSASPVLGLYMNEVQLEEVNSATK